jgi:hypothetical protein
MKSEILSLCVGLRLLLEHLSVGSYPPTFESSGGTETDKGLQSNNGIFNIHVFVIFCFVFNLENSGPQSLNEKIAVR